MPTSLLAIWPEVLAMVDQVPHATILDVGPGWGKAAVLLREYLTDRPAAVDAVEKWHPYVGAHGLRRLYRTVIVADACDLADNVLDGYELVLMCDVIEHMTKDAALGLLGRIRGRVVICTPVAWFDNDPRHELPSTEEHVSHWTREDWDQLSAVRPVEVCYESLGGWLVRLGPLP